MAAFGGSPQWQYENALSETESMESETSPDTPGKLPIPKQEFGSGTLDSAYQPQVWRDMGKPLFQKETVMSC